MPMELKTMNLNNDNVHTKLLTILPKPVAPHFAVTGFTQGGLCT